MVKIKCDSCGAINDEGSKFCEKCGNSLNLNQNGVINQNFRNSSNCPYCGSKISSNVKKCNNCGEWIIPNISENNFPILIGYISLLIAFILSIILYLNAPFPTWPILAFSVPLIFSFIIIIYLLTRKDLKSKKHGKILLIIWVIVLIFFIWMYQIDLQTYREYLSYRQNRYYNNYYYY